jgi:small subunit ribosomal protein S7
MGQKQVKEKEELPVPRRGNIVKRKISKDAVFNSEELQKFINKLIIWGQKSKAEKIVYGALTLVQEKTKTDPMQVFNKALDNVRPLLEVKARRVGGATYQVPIEVSKTRSLAIAMQWIRECARKRKDKSMTENLAAELMDAVNNTGESIAKKETLHKTAEANKAFAHFRW